MSAADEFLQKSDRKKRARVMLNEVKHLAYA
jgi:hypothetical protein